MEGSTTFEQNQAQLYQLGQNGSTIPQVLAKGQANDSDWVIIYTVPAGSFIESKELLIYNGDAASVKWRLAIVNPDDALPSGSSTDQPNICMSGELDPDAADRVSLETGLFAGWQILLYSDAGTGVNFNYYLSGLVVTF